MVVNQREPTNELLTQQIFYKLFKKNSTDQETSEIED